MHSERTYRKLRTGPALQTTWRHGGDTPLPIRIRFESGNPPQRLIYCCFLQPLGKTRPNPSRRPRFDFDSINMQACGGRVSTPLSAQTFEPRCDNPRDSPATRPQQKQCDTARPLTSADTAILHSALSSPSCILTLKQQLLSFKI